MTDNKDAMKEQVVSQKVNTNRIAVLDNEYLRVVNFIGRAPSGQVIPPYGENWGINHSWTYGNHLDKLFIMDGLQAMLSTCASNGITQEAFLKYLKDNPELEVYNAHPEVLKDSEGKEVLKCIPFPHHFTTQLIPGTYFNSSMAHMFAFACIQEMMGKQKVDSINLYGIEIWASFDRDEYYYQTGCVDFWIPFCYGKGIQVMLPAYLMYAKGEKNNLYGYIRDQERKV